MMMEMSPKPGKDGTVVPDDQIHLMLEKLKKDEGIIETEETDKLAATMS